MAEYDKIYTGPELICAYMGIDPGDGVHPRFYFAPLQAWMERRQEEPVALNCPVLFNDLRWVAISLDLGVEYLFGGTVEQAFASVNRAGVVWCEEFQREMQEQEALAEAEISEIPMPNGEEEEGEEEIEEDEKVVKDSLH